MQDDVECLETKWIGLSLVSSPYSILRRPENFKSSAFSCYTPTSVSNLIHTRTRSLEISTGPYANSSAMVLGIVMMTAMVPTIIGLNEATKGTRDQENNRKDTARKQRCHLVAMCEVNKGTQTQREQVHNARVYVGRDGNVSTDAAERGKGIKIKIKP
jgi:hypothetical protein